MAWGEVTEEQIAEIEKALQFCKDVGLLDDEEEDNEY